MYGWVEQKSLGTSKSKGQGPPEPHQGPQGPYLKFFCLSITGYEDADSLAIRAEAETADCTCEAVKGQLISKCLLCVIVWTKKPTKKFPRFLP